MGLITDAFKELQRENFDPKKDDISSRFQPIPDGTYTVALSGVNYGTWDSRTDYVRFSPDVVAGEQMGRQEHVVVYSNETKKDGIPKPKSLIICSTKMARKIGAMTDFEVPDKVFMGANESEDYELIQEAFHNAGVIGKLLKLTIKTTSNKNDPDHPWRNHKSDTAEQPTTANIEDPFKDTQENVEIKDNDLPFQERLNNRS